MKTIVIAALAAALLTGSALASEPAPAPAAAATKADVTVVAPAAASVEPKPAEKKPADGKTADPKKAAGGTSQKAAPKAGAAVTKEPPCEPVKPCPIE